MFGFKKKGLLGLLGLGTYPALPTPTHQISLNGKKFVCMGKPYKTIHGRSHALKPGDMEELQCVRADSSKAVYLTDAEEAAVYAAEAAKRSPRAAVRALEAAQTAAAKAHSAAVLAAHRAKQAAAKAQSERKAMHFVHPAGGGRTLTLPNGTVSWKPPRRKRRTYKAQGKAVYKKKGKK